MSHFLRRTKTTKARNQYGVAISSRLVKIINLFCKRPLQKRRYSAKETCKFKEPTNGSHPISLVLSQEMLCDMTCLWHDMSCHSVTWHVCDMTCLWHGHDTASRVQFLLKTDRVSQGCGSSCSWISQEICHAPMQWQDPRKSLITRDITRNTLWRDVWFHFREQG